MDDLNEQEEKKIEEMIDSLVERAKKASEEYLKFDQETVDNITKAMSMAGLENHMKLAKMAVEETGRGIYEDKITKNMFATEYVYHSIKKDQTVGVISKNDEEGYSLIAEPIGVIAGVTPVTNPTSTVMFKSLISAKTRNVIIFGFHPSAQNCSREAADLLRRAMGKKIKEEMDRQRGVFVEGCKKIEKTHRVSAQLCVIVLMNSGHQEYAKGNEDKKSILQEWQRGGQTSLYRVE